MVFYLHKKSVFTSSIKLSDKQTKNRLYNKSNNADISTEQYCIPNTVLPTIQYSVTIQYSLQYSTPYNTVALLKASFCLMDDLYVGVS